jgi:hypothetical protein
LASFTGDKFILEVNRQLVFMLDSMGPAEESMEEERDEQLEAAEENASPSRNPDSSELTEL